ncbi:hypothetical protein [Streptomyces sp. SS]|uniref:hypothetical protein n=1 Tax=Streptomyces sp. SS TaxID=260742 RepID=UPI0002E20EFB|nr:hypothetical protein [Streptomyces sp. SS]
MPEPFPSITALDQFLGDLRVGEARRRQLGMVRGELQRALDRGALPVGTRRSLRRLLGEDALAPYKRLAESGVLRARRVQGGYPPTSEATNEARAQCLDLLREAYGLPTLRLGAGSRVSPQPTPAFGDLAALRRQLDQDLGGHMTPGRIRLTAVLSLVLDAAPRSGELVAMRLSSLRPGAVYVDRRPQHGDGQADGDWFELSTLSTAALAQWLPLRAQLVERTHGTSKLWVSLRPNHDGVLDGDGQATLRPAGVPLEEKGLTTSYSEGRFRYGLNKLPPKLERLRRAVLDQAPPVALTAAPAE